MKYVLGIDFGGGSSKATLLSQSGAVAATAVSEYPTSYPKSGMAEQNPEDWYKTAVLNIKSVLEKLKEQQQVPRPVPEQTEHKPSCLCPFGRELV